MSNGSAFWPLTDAQHMIRETARRFAERDVKPLAKELDESACFSKEIYNKMAEVGLLGITIPVQWGGTGADTLSYAIVMEELSRGYASIADLCGLVELDATLLSNLGSQPQKERFLVPLLRAELTCAFALTEPNTGSDLASITTQARKTADGYVLNGRKTLIHNGPICDFALVLARAPEQPNNRRSFSIFIVDAKLPGFSRGKKENKMGQRASQLSDLIFEGCPLPSDALLGKEGEGLKNIMMILDKGRIGIAALALGITRAALEESLKYATTREQFGRPIADFQAIQWKLAEMATDIFAARAMIWHAARLLDQGVTVTMHASMAKLFASETAVKHTSAAVQIHGGYGYIKDYPVERLYRDAKITQIYEGTSEIQNLVIARNLLKKGLMP
jgi:hypothetical protein